jgi:uncharacterized protein
MKLYSGKIEIIAAEICNRLLSEETIETENTAEVELDLASVMTEYLRRDRQLTEQAKDICEKQGMPYSAFSKMKRQLARKEGFVIGEDTMDYIMDQMIAQLLHSPFVEEVFAEDHELKVMMRDILRKHTEIEDDMDVEARQKIKNLKEGTTEWDIEYRKAMDQVMKRRKLN